MHTPLGAVPSFSDRTMNPRSTIWLLTGLLGAGGPKIGWWLVLDLDQLPRWQWTQKVIFPVSGGPLRKYSPSVVTPVCPLHSSMHLKEQTLLCSFHSQRHLWCKSIFWRMVCKPFWRDSILHTPLTYHQNFPIPRQQQNFWIARGVKDLPSGIQKTFNP